jgi:phosphoribosyl-ATP pyrophosphohydrolase
MLWLDTAVPQAADAIERLTRERDEARQWLLVVENEQENANAEGYAEAKAHYEARITKLEADNAKLREALATSRERDSFDALIDEARAEAAKAMRKFPQPNYVISKVAEEAGEVVKAAIHCAEGRETPENVRGEMRQLIAMLYRMWVEGDQVHGLAAISGLKEPT